MYPPVEPSGLTRFGFHQKYGMRSASTSSCVESSCGPARNWEEIWPGSGISGSFSLRRQWLRYHFLLVLRCDGGAGALVGSLSRGGDLREGHDVLGLVVVVGDCQHPHGRSRLTRRGEEGHAPVGFGLAEHLARGGLDLVHLLFVPLLHAGFCRRVEGLQVVARSPLPLNPRTSRDQVRLEERGDLYAVHGDLILGHCADSVGYKLRAVAG